MSEYEKQALDFLSKSNAVCRIEFGGTSFNPNWKDKDLRNFYNVTLSTPIGTMGFIFWDSVYNTEISKMNIEDYCKKARKRVYSDLNYSEKIKLQRELKLKQESVKPTEYDILACLQKSDVGTFDEFCSEFGYDNDSITAYKIYVAVEDEYKKLTRIFSKEQMIELQEIN